MKKVQLFFVVMFFLFAAFKSDKPAYSLFGKNGKSVKYAKMVKDIAKADIVLFGEYHNNPVTHWLQLEVTKDLYEIKGENLILGAEMFESDNQLILNEYLDSIISQKSFETEARLWPNYKTDYKPLIEFANKNRLKFVASNVPRRYAAVVNKKGFEGLEELSDEAKKLIPPLPIRYDAELPCYKNMLTMMGMGTHVSENFPKAQALKDATMAHFILKNLTDGKLLLHFEGSYHSDNYEGIYWHLKQQNPKLKIVTITTVSQADVSKLADENKGKADYTICVVDDMTGTR